MMSFRLERIFALSDEQSLNGLLLRMMSENDEFLLCVMSANRAS